MNPPPFTPPSPTAVLAALWLCQDRDATDDVVRKGEERLAELLQLCSNYMLRRWGRGGQVSER